MFEGFVQDGKAAMEFVQPLCTGELKLRLRESYNACSQRSTELGIQPNGAEG